MRDVFIGRAGQLEALNHLLDTADGGIAGAAVLAGETGVGKSRLLQEFERQARRRDAIVLRGACVNLAGGVIPYAPLSDALRRFAREYDSAEIERLGGEAYTQLRDLLSGGGLHQAGPSALVFGAVLRLLNDLGDHQPLVLLFEDLHWADASTVDLLAYLTRAMTSERVLMVCSVSTDELRNDQLETLLTQNVVEWIELPRFTFDELRTFVEQSLPAPVESLVLDRWFELSSGNALIATQLAQVGVPSATTADLPTRLRTMMLVRIRRLPEPASRVLKTAAVVGRAFHDGLLLAASGLDHETLNRALHECVDQHLLFLDRAQDAFAFAHGVLRETVYRELLPAEARELHRRVAEAIDADHNLSLAGGDLADAELAYHWMKAGALDRALPSLIRAGDAERAARAYVEAEIHYEEALRVWRQLPNASKVAGQAHDEVLAAAADAARWTGQVPLALTRIRQAIREVDASHDPGRAGGLYERLGSYLFENGESSASKRAFQDAIRILDGDRTSTALVRAYTGLALAEARVGRYEQASPLAGKAVEVAKSVPDRAVLGRAQNALGSVLGLQGNTADGIELCEAALEIAKTAGGTEDLYRAYGNLGVLYEQSGDLAFAAEIEREGLEGLKELKLGRTRQANLLANNLAATLSMLGEWAEAAELIEDVLTHGTEAAKRYPRLTLAEIEVARGRFDRAQDLLAQIRINPGEQDPRFQSPFYACTAELALWRRDQAGAMAAVSAGIDAAHSAAETLSLLRFCAVGLRTVAEDALRHDRGGPVQLVEAQVLMDLVRRAEVMGESSREASTLVRLCETEFRRISSEDTADEWAALGNDWAGMQRPYPQTYARMQEASAARRSGDGSRLESAIRMAYYQADRLGALPLRERVEELANSVGIVMRKIDASLTVQQPAKVQLTPRQTAVAQLLAQGSTYQEIARQLGVSAKTVNTHVEMIYRKLGAHSATGAVMRLMELGYLDANS